VICGAGAIPVGLTGAIHFNTDGTLDATFGTGGVVTTDFGGDDRVQGLTVQGDGKLVIAGSTDNGSDIIVARYNAADGSLDTTFDGDGKRFVDFAGQSAGAADVAVEASGKVVVSGATGGNAVVVRLTAAGATDATYAGGAGYRTVDFGGADTSLRMTLDGAGRAVVAGRTNVAGDAFLFRLTTGGDLDTTFSADGKLTLNFGGAGDEASGVTVDDRGRIVLGGTGGSVNDDLVAARVLPDGTMDTSFSGDGLAYADFGGADEGVAN